MGRRAGLSVPRKRKPSASPTASTRTPRKRPRRAAQAPQLSPVLRASRKKRHVRAEGSNTPEERMYIYADYHHWVKSGKSSGGVAAIAKKYNVHRQYPARLYSKGTPVDRRAFNPGRPYLLSDKDMEQIKKLLEEHHYDLSYREIEELVVNLDMGSPADTTIWRAMERAGYKLSSRRLRPLLTELHKAERLAFAIKHLERHWGNVIELDEKYFYAWSPRRKLKVPPGVKAPRMRMQSKRFVPKVMVLTGIGKPSTKFNGKLGCWRITKTQIAKRGSKNRTAKGIHAGDEFEVDCNMDGDTWLRMLKEDVIPAIRSKMKHYKRVFLQADNAPGHAKKRAGFQDEIVEAFNAGRKQGEPEIQWLHLPQPAQSPDLNKNDLGFYASIDSKLPQVRSFDLDALFAEVETAFDEYDPDLLTRIDRAKQIVLQRIIDVKGDNDYDHHGRDGE